MTDTLSEQLKTYIAEEVVKHSGVEITEDTPLISSGLIDSMALVDILEKLEELTRLRIPAGKIQPKDMETIRLMIDAARRIGRPR